MGDSADDEDVKEMAFRIYLKCTAIGGSVDDDSSSFLREQAGESIRAARIFQRAWNERYILDRGDFE